MTFNRRDFLSSIPVLAISGKELGNTKSISSPADPQSLLSSSRKLSLNAYSFNDMLMKKLISHNELLEFCANTGFQAIDMTGYYFSSYPSTPSDDEIYAFKRMAHQSGIAISGTGVRNEFSWQEKSSINKEIDLVKRWIVVAAKLGAPVLRVFTAKKYEVGEERKRVRERMLNAFQECVTTAKSHGVILGIQNHNDFLRTAEECKDIIEAVNSQWLGLVVDTGNFIADDPYEEIRKSIPMAVNWQVKEKLLINGTQMPMNLGKLCKIIKQSSYQGYIPIETLGMQDPKKDIPLFFKAVSEALK